MRSLVVKSLSATLMCVGLLAWAPSAADAVIPAVAEDGVRVVNNYGAMVNVYLEDADGRVHRLGRVGIGGVEEFAFPEEAAQGSFRVRVYPSHPIWSAQQEEFGIKTNPIEPGAYEEITFWVEPDLTRSVLEFRD